MAVLVPEVRESSERGTERNRALLRTKGTSTLTFTCVEYQKTARQVEGCFSPSHCIQYRYTCGLCYIIQTWDLGVFLLIIDSVSRMSSPEPCYGLVTWMRCMYQQQHELPLTAAGGRVEHKEIIQHNDYRRNQINMIIYMSVK